MQALKALVIFMGVLIAIGVTVIGVTIYRRAADMASAEKAVSVAPVAPAVSVAPVAPAVSDVPVAPPVSGTSPGAPPPAPSGVGAPGFGMRSLDLPPGSIIVSAQPFDSRVLAHVRLPDGGTSILLLDPATGDIAGEWRAFGAGAEGTPVPTRPQPGGRAGRP